MTSKKITLSKPEDWHTWLSFVKMKATNLDDIWPLINPEFPVKPVALPKPIEPTFDLGADPINFNRQAYELYKVRHQLYKSALVRYDKQSEAFSSIITFIQETITAQNAILIQHVEPHPYHLLKALQERLAPTDAARKLELRNRYRKLQKGPNNQSMEAWINDWSLMFVEASACNLAEVQGDQPITDFLLAIRSKDAAYAAAQLSNLDLSLNPRTMNQIIENYRQYVRLEAAAQKGGEHSAFSAATYRGNETPVPTCLCGMKHWYPDCYYYNPSHPKKPTGWIEKPEIRQKINESLKNPRILENVKKSLARRASSFSLSDQNTQQATSSSTATAITPATTTASAFPLAIFASSFRALAAQSQSSLRNLIILDSGADIHVCNEAMKHLYTKDRDAHPDDRVLAGGEEMIVESYGSLRVDVDTPTGSQIITLINVAYVPNFLASVVSLNLFAVKGVYFDNSRPHLHQNGKTVFRVYRIGGHYTFKPAGQQHQVHEHRAYATAIKITKAIEVLPEGVDPIESTEPIEAIEPTEPTEPIEAIDNASAGPDPPAKPDDISAICDTDEILPERVNPTEITEISEPKFGGNPTYETSLRKPTTTTTPPPPPEPNSPISKASYKTAYITPPLGCERGGNTLVKMGQWYMHLLGLGETPGVKKVKIDYTGPEGHEKG